MEGLLLLIHDLCGTGGVSVYRVRPGLFTSTSDSDLEIVTVETFKKKYRVDPPQGDTPIGFDHREAYIPQEEDSDDT